VADYHDGWLTVDKAFKGKTLAAPVRGTKTRRSKRLPVSEELRDWIERHVEPSAQLSGARAGLPPISLYEGTKHSMATDAIRRGVSERHLQTFLGHRNVQSTRRYARLADNAMLEVLRPPKDVCRQAADKGSENEPEQDREVTGGPSRTRTWALPVMSRLL